MCVCCHPPLILDAGLWTYQPGLDRRKVPQDFSTFLLSEVLALIFPARRNKPFIFLVDHEVEFCVLTD